MSEVERSEVLSHIKGHTVLITPENEKVRHAFRMGRLLGFLLFLVMITTSIFLQLGSTDFLPSDAQEDCQKSEDRKLRPISIAFP